MNNNDDDDNDNGDGDDDVNELIYFAYECRNVQSLDLASMQYKRIYKAI